MLLFPVVAHVCIVLGVSNCCKGPIVPSYASGSLSIVPVRVDAETRRSGKLSEAPTGDAFVLATVKVCSASIANWVVTIFLVPSMCSFFCLQ